MKHHAAMKRSRLMNWVTLLLTLVSANKSNAFSRVKHVSSAISAQKQMWKRVAVDTQRHVTIAAFILAIWQPLEPAHAAPFNETPLLPAGINYKLSDSDAFKRLPRQPVLSGAVKELKDLQDLQDSRLNACEDKGKFWEQCFMYGQSDVDVRIPGEDRGRMDSQLISPMGALNAPANARKIPTW